MPFKLLITSAEFAQNNPRMVEKTCREYGCEAVFNPNPGAMSAADILALNAQTPVHGILVYSSSDEINRKVFEGCRELKVVSRHGVGIENIDKAAAKETGAIIKTTIGLDDHQSVADLALGLMLGAARQIPQTDADLKTKTWSRRVGVNVWSKTLGLIGFGRIGRAVARRAKGFDMQILVFDPYTSPEEAQAAGAEAVDLPALLEQSDFISLHCFMDENNRGMIGADELEKMKSQAIIINTARAELIDQAALAEALQAGSIGGAGLDVFPKEPATDDPLIGSGADKLIVSPHVGSYTTETLAQMDLRALTNALEEMS